MNAKVGVFETEHTGHFLGYVAIVLRELESRGVDAVFLTTSEVVESTEFRMIPSSTKVAILTDGKLTTAVMASQRELCTRLVVPNGDPHILSLAVRKFPIDITGLIMSDPAWELPQARNFRRRSKLLAKTQLIWLAGRRKRNRILRLAAPTWDNAKKTSLAMDPVTLHGVRAEKRSVESSGSFTIALLGNASPRKNPVTVAKSVALVRASGRDVRLRLRGEVSAEDLVAICEALPDPQAFVNDSSPMTPEEFDQEILQADAVVCAYSTHAPNSTVSKAAYAGTQIIAAGSPTFQNFVHEVSGVATASLDPQEIAGLIELALIGQLTPGRRPPYGEHFFSAAMLGGL